LGYVSLLAAKNGIHVILLPFFLLILIDVYRRTTLWGAKPDDKFSILHDAPQALDRTKSFHFPPGTEYSYSNVNFHVLGRILENVTGMSLAQILVDRLFIPAGMATASLCPNTNGLPLPIVGYEGNATVGYFAATNRIEWAGDAGIAASLEDMIAYEIYLDRSTSDPGSLYAATSKQQLFRDGSPASYGYGLTRSQRAGKTAVSHGGALRGFRHERLYIPEERLSTVVLLNYEAPPSVLTDFVLEKVLRFEEPKPKDIAAASELHGDFLDPDTMLYLEIKTATTGGEGVKPGTVSMNYGPGTTGATLKLTSGTAAESPGTKLRIEGDFLHVERVDDNRSIRARRIQRPADASATRAAGVDVVGRYRCEEADSSFTVSGGDGVLYGSFDGFLGRGPVWVMRFLGEVEARGERVWALGNPRSLDSTPPGDWTVVFKRGEDGSGKEVVEECTVGCWLARGLQFAKV
jgi:CubicO group peptidase (beta-lactamase class C family)